ncbi:replication-relaxation family protein [Streptomyces sp. H27-C3]|uniref:replication-relaxation family protein n=1 Tax=Streptomyces sp. H27-C3 TaxID=3046305 RepID=UPI0024B888CA|nr:replication-relaxation family protein [Streptomyces sp. H27-C3]MDJ0465910.1 replication-relaxation family protein [Streptomyces sp. H27-C3]
MRQLFQDHLDLRALREEDAVRARPAPRLGSDQLSRSRLEFGHQRELSTLFGTVTVRRCAWRAPGQSNVHPADAALSLPRRQHSHGLARLAVIESVRGSFDATEFGTALGEVGDWEVEVAHPLGAGGVLVPDAVLHLPFSNLSHVFVELDRATMSLGKLINKVAAYDRYRYYAHRPTTPRAVRSAGAGPAGLPHWFTRYPRAGAEMSSHPC